MGRVKITTKKNIAKLEADVKAKGMNFSEISKELGFDRSYLAGIKVDGEIDPVVFKYICAKFNLNESDYEPVEETKNAPQDSTEVVRVLGSINQTLFEINRRLGILMDTANKIDGKTANINVDTHESKTLIKDLLKEFEK